MTETLEKTLPLGEFLVNQPVDSFPINGRLICYPKKLWIEEAGNPKPIDLTPREVFALLVLANNYDTFLPYQRLFYNESPSLDSQRVFIHKLRAKIEYPNANGESRHLISDKQGRIKFRNPDRDGKLARTD